MQLNLVMAALLLMASSAAAMSPSDSSGQSTPKPVIARNVVLVHGAWADGSSWSKVIPLLQAEGLHVTAVQNSLSTLAEADADARRAIAAQDGPTVLVGHSWSGTVVSDVGDDPKVTALVYVAARAPAAGEDFLALQGTFPNTPVRAGVVTGNDGYTTLSQSAFLQAFANGVPRRVAMVLYAVQGPTKASLFAERTSATAWKSKPTYYAVSKQDRTIAPQFEAFLAKRMNADTIEVNAGHLSMVTRPDEIAKLIIRAARGKK
jgi:pimeloyl-ACP methyl ester carboxylesterase